MFSFNKFPWSAILALAICVASSTAAFAQANASLAPQQTAWLGCLDTLLDADKQRLEAVGAYIRRLDERAAEQFQGRKIDAILDALVSLTSQTKEASDSVAWKGWLREQFLLHAFDMEQFKNVIRTELARLERDLDQIDDQTIIKLGYDVDVESVLRQIPEPQLDYSKFDLLVDEAVAAIAPHVHNANVEGAARGAGKLVVGGIAQKQAADALRDEEGNLSWSGFFGSILFGVAVEEVGDALVETASTTREDLRQAAGDATLALLEGYIKKGPAAELHRRNLRDRIVRRKAILSYCVMRELGVDPAWANKTYLEADEKRLAAAK